MQQSKFIQYHNNYKLGRWKGLDPRSQFSILGELDDQYITFDHYCMVFCSMLKSDALIIDNADDINFRNGFCINKKGVYHPVSGFKNEINDCVNFAITKV